MLIECQELNGIGKIQKLQGCNKYIAVHHMEVLMLPPHQKKSKKKLIACYKDVCYWMV